MENLENLSYPQKLFSAIFSENLIYNLLIEDNEEEATIITDKFVDSFIKELRENEEEKSVDLIEAIINVVFRQGLTLQDVANKTAIGYETVYMHYCFMLRKMRYPSRSKVYKNDIKSLLR